MSKMLWVVLVPTVHSDSGNPIRVRHHRRWDAKVRAFYKTLVAITEDERDWYADLAGDDLAGEATKSEIKALDHIQERYNRLGKEPK